MVNGRKDRGQVQFRVLASPGPENNTDAYHLKKNECVLSLKNEIISVFLLYLMRTVCLRRLMAAEPSIQSHITNRVKASPDSAKSA